MRLSDELSEAGTSLFVLISSLQGAEKPLDRAAAALRFLNDVVAAAEESLKTTTPWTEAQQRLHDLIREYDANPELYQ